MSGFLESKGMQMMLAQLVKSAAPQLVETVEQFSGMVQNFDRRLTAVETALKYIIEREYGLRYDDIRKPIAISGNATISKTNSPSQNP